MVVGGAGLAAKFSVAIFAHVAPEALARAAGLAHAALEQLLHEESTLVGDDLLAPAVAVEDFVAVLVDNAGDEHRVVVHAVVGHGAIGIGHFQQGDVA